MASTSRQTKLETETSTTPDAGRCHGLPFHSAAGAGRCGSRRGSPPRANELLGNYVRDPGRAQTACPGRVSGDLARPSPLSTCCNWTRRPRRRASHRLGVRITQGSTQDEGVAAGDEAFRAGDIHDQAAAVVANDQPLHNAGARVECARTPDRIAERRHSATCGRKPFRGNVARRATFDQDRTIGQWFGTCSTCRARDCVAGYKERCTERRVRAAGLQCQSPPADWRAARSHVWLVARRSPRERSAPGSVGARREGSSPCELSPGLAAPEQVRAASARTGRSSPQVRGGRRGGGWRRANPRADGFDHCRASQRAIRADSAIGAAHTPRSHHTRP